MQAAEASRRRRPICLLLVLCWLAVSIAPGAAVRAAGDSGHAVVLLYHHVSEATPPSTSITPANFERHLDYLAEHDYAVLALETLVRALADGTQLPSKAVALTFDDGYDSIYTEALPRLERRGWPFTVFIATDPIDRGFAGFMRWEELRDLERRGATIANHGTDHAHLIRRGEGETDQAWRVRVAANIATAQRRLEAELEHPARLFAYPYGEFDTPLEAVVAELGFVAFGQQSGPVGPSSNRLGLPRFPMATGFDSLAGLAEKLRTRPLPVEVLAPSSRVLLPGAGAPTLEIDVPEGPYRRGELVCYVAGQEPARITWQGSIARIQARRPLGAGRGKYNCTAPSSTEGRVFYWYSHLWMQPRDDGSWYAE